MTVKNFLFFQSSAASSLGALRLSNAVQSALHRYIPANRSETAGPTETTARPRLQGRSWLSSLEANDYANFAARRVVV